MYMGSPSDSAPCEKALEMSAEQRFSIQPQSKRRGKVMNVDLLNSRSINLHLSVAQ